MRDGGDAWEPIEPILRWAGGKRWLVPQLPKLVGSLEMNNFHEPFLGGASVFLGLPTEGKAYLSDLNAELIETYQQVRDDVDAVAGALRKYRNTPEDYYRVRGQRLRSPSARAARFIFLNHTSFNGIYRVNLKGVYNVPYGRRGAPKIPDRHRLRAVSNRLQGVQLSVADFADCLANVTAGDLVFLDPPYTVAHNNNGFIRYNRRLFSFEDQGRLSDLIDEIRNRGAYYILTNAAHVSIAELFDKGDRRLGTSRKNAVGGRTAARGAAVELLFTNVGAS